MIIFVALITGMANVTFAQGFRNIVPASTFPKKIVAGEYSEITLNGSQVGVNYQLYGTVEVDNKKVWMSVGDSIEGTGEMLTFVGVNKDVNKDMCCKTKMDGKMKTFYPLVLVVAVVAAVVVCILIILYIDYIDQKVNYRLGISGLIFLIESFAISFGIAIVRISEMYEVSETD